MNDNIRLEYVASATVLRSAMESVERIARNIDDKVLRDIAATALAKADALEAIEDFDNSKIGPTIASVVVRHPCDECDGTGEVERQIGGDDNGWGAAAALADVPMVCGLCDGTGVL